MVAILTINPYIFNRSLFGKRFAEVSTKPEHQGFEWYQKLTKQGQIWARDRSSNRRACIYTPVQGGWLQGALDNAVYFGMFMDIYHSPRL
jgi:hypothetical protein